MIHAMARMDLTRTLLRRGDLSGAIGIAQEVVASDPSNPHFLEQLGDYYVYANRSQDALEAFDRVIALKPQDADAWSKRGYALQQLDRKEEAIASYEEALTADPRHRSSRHNRWGLLLLLGRASQVAEEAAVALKRDGADAEARWASIRARLAMGEAEDLIPELELAVRESPRDGSLKMELAMLLELRGDQKRAETLYREVMASDPAHSLAPIRLARLLIGAGRHSEAKRLLEGADRLRRDATFLRLLAEARLGAGDATGAAEALNEALRLAPGRAEIWSALGTLQLQHGDSQGALRSLREAVALDPRDASAWRAMAEAHERLGQSGPAAQARERARQAAGG
jgi:Flp pilus assembly protein TadD